MAILTTVFWLGIILLAVAAMAWGADTFADHLAKASVRLGVSSFALALLLAGAEPEELITALVSSWHRAPAIAFGDAIGTNIFICLGALGLAGILSGLVFNATTWFCGVASLLVSIPAVVIMWDGQISRINGLILMCLYAIFIGAIWFHEHKPPVIGEIHEIEKARRSANRNKGGLRSVILLSGMAAMAVAGPVLVEAIQRITGVEAGQARYSLTLIGFATGFEFLALAWATRRRGQTATLLAAVFGSFAYNMTMTLGAAGVFHPLVMTEREAMRRPLIIAMLSLCSVLLIALPKRAIRRGAGIALVLGYAAFVAVTLWRE